MSFATEAVASGSCGVASDGRAKTRRGLPVEPATGGAGRRGELANGINGMRGRVQPRRSPAPGGGLRHAKFIPWASGSKCALMSTSG